MTTLPWRWAAWLSAARQVSRWEWLLHGLVWGGIVVVLGSGERNGIGWFQQPRHSLWIPLLIGAGCNAAIFVLAGMSARAALDRRGRVYAIQAAAVAVAIGLLVKTVLHRVYVALWVPDLADLRLIDFAVENSYSLFGLFLLGAAYGLARKAVVKPQSERRVLWVKSGLSSERLAVDEIRYLKAEANYVAYHLDDRAVLVLQTMDAALAALDDPRYLRVHRSYIVNLDHVDGYERGTLRLGPLRLPVGRTYRQLVQRQMADRSTTESA